MSGRLRRIPAALAASVAAAFAAGAVQAAEPPRCALGKAAEFPVTMAGPRALIPVVINGQKLQMMVDTGAFFSDLTEATVAKLGLKTEVMEDLLVSGLGGVQFASKTSVDSVVLGEIKLHRSDFLIDRIVLGSGAAGLIGQNLIGVSDAEYDLANGVIRLFIPQGSGCKTAPRAYWAPTFSVIELESTNWAKPSLIGRVTVNGVSLRATFDTGSYTSIINLRAAARAGITPQSPGVVPTAVSGGIGGSRQFQTWVAPVESFSAGQETIRKTRIQIGDFGSGDLTDMLVGADFFLAHRVYFAKDQNKLYFTYNGGSVFNLGQAPAKAPPNATTAEGRGNTPTDAAGFLRRASASMSRRDFKGAVADYSQAVKRDPTAADPLVGRARAYEAADQPELAMADLSEALKLKPGNAEGRMARGRMFLAEKQIDRARADFDAALASAPEDGALPRRVANSFAGERLYADGLGYLDRWVAAHAGHADMVWVLNLRCWLRGEWGQELDKAMADCDAALKMAPRSPELLDSRGLVELRMGRLDQAIADYDAALARRPKAAWTLYARGVAEQRKGLKAKGDADVAAALAIDPDTSGRASAIGLEAQPSPVVSPSK